MTVDSSNVQLCPDLPVEHNAETHKKPSICSQICAVHEDKNMYLHISVLEDKCIRFYLTDDGTSSHNISPKVWLGDINTAAGINYQFSFAKVHLRQDQMEFLLNDKTVEHGGVVDNIKVQNIGSGLLVGYLEPSPPPALQVVYLSWSDYADLQKVVDNVYKEVALMTPFLHNNPSTSPTCAITNREVLKHIITAIACKIYDLNSLDTLYPKLPGKDVSALKISAINRVTMDVMTLALMHRNHTTNKDLVNDILKEDFGEIYSHVSENYVYVGATFFMKSLSFQNLGFHTNKFIS